MSPDAKNLCRRTPSGSKWVIGMRRSFTIRYALPVRIDLATDRVGTIGLHLPVFRLAPNARGVWL